VKQQQVAIKPGARCLFHCGRGVQGATLCARGPGGTTEEEVGGLALRGGHCDHGAGIHHGLTCGRPAWYSYPSALQLFSAMVSKRYIWRTRGAQLRLPVLHRWVGQSGLVGLKSGL
jgi:hypothetical protein